MPGGPLARGSTTARMLTHHPRKPRKRTEDTIESLLDTLITILSSITKLQYNEPVDLINIALWRSELYSHRSQI